MASGTPKEDGANELASIVAIQALLDAYDSLSHAANAFRKAAQKDQGFPLYLPTYDGPLNTKTEIKTGRDVAIASICNFWHLDEGEIPVRAGYLCASENSVTQVKKLNHAKEKFKKAVLALRGDKKSQHSRLDMLIEQILPKEETERPKKLMKALKSAGLSRLDLPRCYANIRVMPEDLQSISWTWATTHSASTKPITVADAMAIAEKLAEGKKRDAILHALSQRPSTDKLAYKRRLPNRLQANIVSLKDGERKRASVTISGIVICPGQFAPAEAIWRDDPGEQENNQPTRVKRFDAKITDEVVVSALNLHALKGEI